ncbi:MAG: energy transducer TonB [Raineya sp.]|jgi:hypothetical protein|nr:energy transducer TonB [Raineya sp.]
MQNFKISIPKPCHEDWQKMTPQDKGRFCGACSKVVVDFTQMTEEEIIRFFQNNQNEKICGNVRKIQLDAVYKPQNLLEKHYIHIHKTYKNSWFRNIYLSVLSSLLILTGCQNEEKVGDVEAIKTEVKKDSLIYKTSVNTNQKKRVEIVEELPEQLMGELVAHNPREIDTSIPNKINAKLLDNPDHIFEDNEASQDAYFEGGLDGLENALEKEIIYTETEKTKSNVKLVYIQFVINQEGKMESIEITKHFWDGFKDISIEALEKVNQKYTWKPALINNKTVKVRKNISIRFKS